ncbi:uncharacterized protein PAC_05437 [Phialocephala subalpina]|uniref:Homeobox domain-containing protein n=1 Tax=Phialocephala subalpina TaxID=576137 RepID=A0A1L7WS03_9HELO|nr:uncharacterized protein PAC_05437 [Phialocephala subalpina]
MDKDAKTPARKSIEELAKLEAQFAISPDTSSTDELEQLAKELPGRSTRAISIWFSKRRQLEATKQALEIFSRANASDDDSPEATISKNRGDIDFPGLLRKAANETRIGVTALGREAPKKKGDASSPKKTKS